MNSIKIFFGKISASNKLSKKQISEKRYYAKKGLSYFGDIGIGDYCCIINGNDIYFWQAKSWDKFEEIFEGKLPINGNKFRALKFLQFNSDLMVNTIRKVPKKSFFKLELTEQIDIKETV